MCAGVRTVQQPRGPKIRGETHRQLLALPLTGGTCSPEQETFKISGQAFKKQIKLLHGHPEQKQSPNINQGEQGAPILLGLAPISLLFPPVLHQLVFLL